MKTGSATLVASFALALCACSSSSSGGDAGSTGPAPVAIEQVPALVAQAECDLLTRCLGPLAVAQFPGGDCVDRTTKQLAQGELGAAMALVSAGKLPYDGTKVSACLGAIFPTGCAIPSNPHAQECLAAFPTKNGVGSDCTIDQECGLAYCAGGTGGTCPGKCTAYVAVGAACTKTAMCAAGSVCSSGVCTLPAMAGQACDQGAPPCAGGLLCLGADKMMKTPGTCKSAVDAANAALGATCDLSKGPFCQPNTFCGVVSVSAQGATFQCVAASTAGGACKVALPESCPSGQACNADLAGGKVDGTCGAPPKDGDPCDALNRCGPSSVCVAMGGMMPSTVCRPLVDVGGTCDSNAVCISSVCQAGKCVQGTSCSMP